MILMGTVGAARAARITASSDAAKFPIGSTRTIFGGPADLQIGAAYSDWCPPVRYRTFWRLSAGSVGHRLVMFGLLLVGFGVAPLLNSRQRPNSNVQTWTVTLD